MSITLLKRLNKGSALTHEEMDNNLSLIEGAINNATGGAGTDSELVFFDVTTNDVSTTKHGFAPKLPGDASKFLNGNGLYTVPNDSTKEPAIALGLGTQYWRGDKSWQTLNATAVGLGNVTNESKATMFSSPAFTGSPTASGIFKSSFVVASGQSGFNTAVTTLGNIHINCGAGTGNSDYREGAITFQGGAADQAQAGIYVINSNQAGTKMAFATTESYATGPQIGMTIDNYGTVNFPRNRPQYAGNTIIDTANIGTYAPTKTGSGASGLWAINISGQAAFLQNSGGSGLQSTSIGLAYNNAVCVREVSGYSGNTAATAAPRLGFHWSAVTASSISIDAGGSFYFNNIDGTSRANIYAANFVGTLSGSHGSFEGTNSGSYGGVQINGTKNGYSGAYLSASQITTGMYDTAGNGGEYDPNSGWITYYSKANRCLGIMGSSTASGYAAYSNGSFYVSGSLVANSSITTYYNYTISGEGYGYCFWSDPTNYKISMGYTPGEYQYGPVTDYSIKMTMGPATGNPGRGVTFGLPGTKPVAAINTTSGFAQFAGTVTAAAFNTSSSKYLKENITELDISALDIVDSTKILGYNYINDKDKKYRIGFLAEDTHPILSGKDQNIFDMQNTIALLLKSVQELNKEIRILKGKK